MAKDEDSKTPPFQLFQLPSKKAEPPPSEKANQPPPPFQQPPVFQKTPTPPLPLVKPPPPVLEDKPRPTIKSARTFNGLTARTKKILWITARILAVVFASYFIITLVLKKSDTPAAPPVEKPEPAPAPKPALAPPAAKPINWTVQTETGSKVNMRALPSEDSQMVIQIPTGAEVVILRYGEEAEVKGEKGRWCRVAYRAQIGWVWGKFVKEK
jgi:hypothetical protein